MQCNGCAEWLDLPLNMNSIFWGAPANLQSFPLNQIETEWVSERETGREWESERVSGTWEGTLGWTRRCRLPQRVRVVGCPPSAGSPGCWVTPPYFPVCLFLTHLYVAHQREDILFQSGWIFRTVSNGILIREWHPSTLKLFWKIINFGTGCLPLVWKCLTVVWWITSP